MGRKKKVALVVGPVVRDPREAAPRVLCPVCEASVREEELVPYLGPDGLEKQRCKDCDSTARADAAGSPRGALVFIDEPTPEPPKEKVLAEWVETRDNAGQLVRLDTPAPAPEKIDKLAVVTAERNRLIRMLCDLPVVGLPTGGSMDDAATVLARIPELIDRSRAAASEADHYVERVREDRLILEESHSKLKSALARVRDLELLLGFDDRPTSKTLTIKTEPWMLDIAAGAAQSAPSHLDEHALVLLLTDTIHRAFAHRTVESGRTIESLSETPACAALLATEEAARHVSVILRGTPLHPIDLRKEAITEAWEAFHVALTRARATVVNEINHLIQLELTEKELARPKVAPPGEGRQFKVEREPEPENFEDEDEDEDDDDDHGE